MAQPVYWIGTWNPPFIRMVRRNSKLQEVLDVNRTADEIEQAYTHTQKHMNNVGSEMISCSPCFAFYYFYVFISSYK